MRHSLRSRAAWTKLNTAESDVEGEYHILVVGENPDHAHNIKVLLANDHYRFTVITSAEQVLKALPEWDLVILDGKMTRMSENEVCRRLREKRSLIELPIMMLSDRCKPADAAAGFAAGANDYMARPVDGSELSARVRTMLRVKTKAAEHARLKAALLQDQIKPHFLYNTLNTIASLGEEDSELMRGLLSEFGDYLRASLGMHNLDPFIPFHKELSLIQSYLYIEKARFAERLSVELEIENDTSFPVLPLSIQPIVENAVRHGIMKRMEGGTIRIKVRDEGVSTTVSVEDNGVGMSEEAVASIMRAKEPNGGLYNTDRRLRRFFGSGLVIDSCLHKGTKVVVHIPKAGFLHAGCSEIVQCGLLH